MLKTRSLGIVAALLAPALGASAEQVAWLNVSDFPGGIEKTDAAWSAIRIDGASNRVAADDFILDRPVRVTAIEFWTVQLTDNPLLGIDWYIFSAGDGKEGPPGKLIAYGAQVKTPHEDTGLVNASFGKLYLERAEMDVPLDAGQYFLAFRCVHQDPNNKGNGSLTTNDQLGASRGWWNFELAADGTVGLPWDKMEIFNLKDNEWAFRILAADEQGCYADCDNGGSLDLFDFLCFQNAFANAEAYADCDENGVFDLFDFLCFQNAFVEGC